MTTVRPELKQQPQPMHLFTTSFRRLMGLVQHRRNDAFDTLIDLKRALEALPLDSDEFSRAINRIGNVAHYIQCAEWGGAGYELTLLDRRSRTWFAEAPFKRFHRTAALPMVGKQPAFQRNS